MGDRVGASVGLVVGGVDCTSTDMIPRIPPPQCGAHTKKKSPDVVKICSTRAPSVVDPNVGEIVAVQVLPDPV